MDIEEIKKIINHEMYPDSTKEHLIIDHLASDKNCIPVLLKMLQMERTAKDELIKDMNLELSRADIHIQEPMLCGSNKELKGELAKFNAAKQFILNCITVFYHKYKGQITHCFNKQI